MSATTAQTERQTLSAAIKAEAGRLGFDLVGIAPAVTPTGFHRLLEWLRRGYAGRMDYLPGRQPAYEHPRNVMEGVKSVVMLAMNYNCGEQPRAGTNQGLVSRYARGWRDYHDVIRERLRGLADFLRGELPECRTRPVVDTAPLLERDFARLAGLGWFGKNTMLINKRLGSWLFLAALLVDAELHYDRPHETDHCGTCTRCLEACPTDAFPQPYVLDARKCISYLNIELRGPIPQELREGMGSWLFGCDICQEVCPWNRKAPATSEAAYRAVDDLSPADAVRLLEMDGDEFRRRFRKTPLWRPKRAGILRNAAVVLGNAGDRRALPALIRALGDSEPVVRGAAAWALGRLAGHREQAALQSQLAVEDNPQVRAEIQGALQGSPPNDQRQRGENSRETTTERGHGQATR